MSSSGGRSTASGDKAADAEKAIGLLSQKLGGFQAQIASPEDAFVGIMEELYEVLGELLTPVLDPIIQRVGDFVRGWLDSAPGKATLDTVADVVGVLAELLRAGAVGAMNTAGVVWAGGNLALDGLLSFWSSVSGVAGDAILGAVERVLAAVESLLSGVGMSAAPVTSARVAIAEARQARQQAKREPVVIDVEPLAGAVSDLLSGQSTFVAETIDVGRERRLRARRTILSKMDQAQQADAARRRAVVEQREEAAALREEQQAPRKVVVRSSEPCRVAFVRRLG